MESVETRSEVHVMPSGMTVSGSAKILSKVRTSLFVQRSVILAENNSGEKNVISGVKFVV